MKSGIKNLGKEESGTEDMGKSNESQSSDRRKSIRLSKTSIFIDCRYSILLLGIPIPLGIDTGNYYL